MPVDEKPICTVKREPIVEHIPEYSSSDSDDFPEILIRNYPLRNREVSPVTQQLKSTGNGNVFKIMFIRICNDLMVKSFF